MDGTEQGKNEVRGGKLVPLALCPPQILQWLTPGIQPVPPQWEGGR